MANFFDEFSEEEAEELKKMREEVEFDQESFDYSIKSMLGDKVVILEDLNFDQFPAGIKKRIYSMSLLLGFFTLVMIYFIAKKVTMIPVYLLFIAFIIVTILKIRVLYLKTSLREYIVFSGIVVDVENKSFLRTSKYQLIKISDSERILNIKFYGTKKINIGKPISVYVDINSTLYKTEDGLVLEDPLGIDFSESTEFMNDEIDVNDFFK